MEQSFKAELAQHMAKIAAGLTKEELQRALGFMEGMLVQKEISDKKPA